MEEMETTPVSEETDSDSSTIIYDANAVKCPAWFAFIHLCMTTVISLLIFFFAWELTKNISNDNILSLAGLFVTYSLFLAYYLYQFIRSRACITRKAIVTDTDIEVSCGRWVKRIASKDVILSIGYFSMFNQCLVLVTDTDYLTINCSRGYHFCENQKEVLEPYEKIYKTFGTNASHISYIKNKKITNMPPMRIPYLFFEVEFDTPRVMRWIKTLREKYCQIHKFK